MQAKNSSKIEHRWDLTPQQAIALQNELCGHVVKRDDFGRVRRVAGIDAGFEEGNTITRAAVAVLAFPSLELVDSAVVRCPTTFPYVPGLLSFREAPAVLLALGKLTQQPDLILYDGQGCAHPRRFGIASHVGLLADIPSIGVAKTRLIGEHAEPADERGAWAPLVDRGEVIGAVLRTKARTKPVYVSIGHRIGLESALRYVMACCTRYRLPETTRYADGLASGRRAVRR